MLTGCSLPYRQLRNLSHTSERKNKRSLPYRQLRNVRASSN
ncbi:hypothetical protein L292_1223 [Acinetobacter junii CIP 107470 = MTCC 11364]|uniref:Uncharacterized protein n=1 Tax=Acinetobacter junii CIP 107470 = MTCC 11364 TaxID=1217666 RepID=S7WDM3_ACIJU|nr:hypothetical protein L292_1223 [Acinetobacter junii CIP 107470 = MTCC 11364]